MRELGDPGAALKPGLDHKENVKPGFILRADGQQSVSRGKVPRAGRLQN